MFAEPEPLISIAVPLIAALLFDFTSIFIPSKTTPFPDLPAILTPFVPDIVIEQGEFESFDYKRFSESDLKDSLDKNNDCLLYTSPSPRDS